MTKKMKLSEWLGQMDGHDIMDRAEAIQDFEKQTGQVADDWPLYSKESIQAMLDAETGKAGGYIQGEGPFTPALDLSDRYARDLANHHSWKIGRGSRHRDNVKAIKDAGF